MENPVTPEKAILFATSSPPTEFHQFLKLPLELRERVFSLATEDNKNCIRQLLSTNKESHILIMKALWRQSRPIDLTTDDRIQKINDLASYPSILVCGSTGQEQGEQTRIVVSVTLEGRKYTNLPPRFRFDYVDLFDTNPTGQHEVRIRTMSDTALKLINGVSLDVDINDLLDLGGHSYWTIARTAYLLTRQHIERSRLTFKTSVAEVILEQAFVSTYSPLSLPGFVLLSASDQSVRSERESERRRGKMSSMHSFITQSAIQRRFTIEDKRSSEEKNADGGVIEGLTRVLDLLEYSTKDIRAITSMFTVIDSEGP